MKKSKYFNDARTCGAGQGNTERNAQRFYSAKAQRTRRAQRRELLFIGWIKRSGSNNLMLLASSFYSLTQPTTSAQRDTWLEPLKLEFKSINFNNIFSFANLRVLCAFRQLLHALLYLLRPCSRALKSPCR